MIDNRRIPWVGIGILAAILMAVVALCCLCSPGNPAPPPAPPCNVPPPPVVVPAPDAGADDAASPCDAAPAPPIAIDAGFDAGPSCGTHPWCPHPKKPCCRDGEDCCSS